MDENEGVTSRVEQVAASLAAVKDRIDAAKVAAGRTDDVLLVVVTKTFPASDVQVLAELGVTDVAENRDQEARRKRAEVEADGRGHGLRWHMIGQVQRNKAASVARWADVVESVDRIELAAALGRAASAADRTIEVLVQVGLDPVHRPERGGADPADVPAIAAAVREHGHLRLEGVMGVAPFPGDPDEAFARLAQVAAQMRSAVPTAYRVSAGMSGDLEQAITHGATQVRIGGAVLGTRPPVQ
jgi:pyridoxal phosphate enzyme (YggS family)